MRYFILFWPGFQRAWHRGEIYATSLAILFGLSLNLAWISSFHWPQLISSSARLSLWCCLIGGSLWSVYRGVTQWSAVFGESSSSPKLQNREQAFRSAQKAYLRAEYFEAEAALYPIFASGSEDVEAALLLAGILRRTQRVDQSLHTLERLSKLEQSQFWLHEIHREQIICRRVATSA